MSTWLAAFIAVAAITTTYLFCIRPHLRGRGHCATTGSPARNTGLDRQIAELREELRVLRAQDVLDSGQIPRSKPTPPASP
ncbi:MAG TPA: hypothetical protein VJ757_07270 [Pseudonocardiaceae bacterium]|nr:hypothetical protein [Pseudonocardiaceae bacterium]